MEKGPKPSAYSRVHGMEAGSVSERKYPLSQAQEVDPSLME